MTTSKSRILPGLILTAVIAAGSLCQAGAQQPLPSDQAAMAKIAQGDSLCTEMLIRMNRRLNTDSITLVLADIERWPEKAMSATYIKYRDDNKPMLQKYAQYNDETMEIISFFMKTINNAEQKGQARDAKFKDYIKGAFKSLTTAGKFSKTTYTYGTVFNNRNNRPSLPYINTRLEKMGKIIDEYSIADPNKTVISLYNLLGELEPVKTRAQIQKEKLDNMNMRRDITTGVAPATNELRPKVTVTATQNLSQRIKQLNTMLDTFAKWEKEGYPSELIYNLRKETRKELDKIEKAQ